jgi:hypothetical protein
MFAVETGSFLPYAARGMWRGFLAERCGEIWDFSSMSPALAQLKILCTMSLKT